MHHDEVIPHLFRTEYRKIVSVLIKRFGLGHIELAEDIASDTFLAASELWGLKGLPDNPLAWLYKVAANKTLNRLKHDRIFTGKIVPQLQLDKTYENGAEADIDLSEHNIRDSQLQMLFSVCHPAISTEAQVGLALRILCGFGISEIADAFLTEPETIKKRLLRAKEKLRAAQVTVAFPPLADLPGRLDAVLLTLYLLFNEGYYANKEGHTIREELCAEAMRLTALLLEDALTNRPSVNALLALMCFQSSRFNARMNASGDLVLLSDQDRERWDKNLIQQGEYFLNISARGDTFSKYHLEAAIAYWHTVTTDTPGKWLHILSLYDNLLQIAYSPIAALNRAYALFKSEGAAPAIAAAESLPLEGNPFYHSLLGELYASTSDIAKAQFHLHNAIRYAKSEADRQLIECRIEEIKIRNSTPF